MGKYEGLRGLSPEHFRRLTGVKLQTFEKMVGILSEEEISVRQRRRRQTGIRSRLSVEDRLLMALEYLREYRTYFHLGRSYGLSESACYRACRTNFSNGKKHDFRLFKESRVRWYKKAFGITDTGYQGFKKLCLNVILPKKASKYHPLTKQDKQANREISSKRALNENVIGMLKRFKIIADCYRNRRKRFGLRFNLISGLYNYEIPQN